MGLQKCTVTNTNEPVCPIPDTRQPVAQKHGTVIRPTERQKGDHYLFIPHTVYLTTLSGAQTIFRRRQKYCISYKLIISFRVGKFGNLLFVYRMVRWKHNALLSSYMRFYLPLPFISHYYKI